MMPICGGTPEAFFAGAGSGVGEGDLLRAGEEEVVLLRRLRGATEDLRLRGGVDEALRCFRWGVLDRLHRVPRVREPVAGPSRG